QNRPAPNLPERGSSERSPAQRTRFPLESNANKASVLSGKNSDGSAFLPEPHRRHRRATTSSVLGGLDPWVRAQPEFRSSQQGMPVRRDSEQYGTSDVESALREPSQRPAQRHIGERET